MSELKKLERLLTQGRMSRRDFLARLSALGITAALSPALLATPARGGTPKKGGRLRLGMAGGSTADSLDPATITDAMAYNINWQVRNCLVEVDYKGNLIPELAESWESSHDAAKWTFKLRKGVEFHNGKTLDAEDVIFSINHHRGKDSKSAAKGIVDPIEDIKADGKHVVVFTLKQGDADFPFITSDPHLSIVPNGTQGSDWEQGIGTGGYILDSYEPGYNALAKGNPNYWKEGRAHFDEVETIGIADVTKRVVALHRGQIDAMNRFQLNLTHLLPRARGIQIINVAGTKHYSIPMLTDREPFNNNDVRLAMKYAIDREYMVMEILRGYGSLGNDHPIAPTQKYYASELPQREYNPDKARFHMKKAGLADYTFRLHAADAAWPGADASGAAMLYREHATKAGIKIEVIVEPDDGYWKDVWMKKPWVMCYWSGRATADWMFSTAYAEDSNWNDTFWKHERFNKLLKAARAELDEAKRRELYVECQRIVRDEGGVVIPMFANWIEAVSEKLRFENPAGNWEMDGYRAAERWWFES
ncbi:MAG: twin-arginine translocation signal domain-containing protein [Proteobacteria bacterium]|nr:twin-arginine translocation signal domain-containing protein [Pseudomonadota bacterium]